MDKRTRGAWIVHHGRKAAADVRGAAEYDAIDFAAKSAGLLARFAETKQAQLTEDEVIAAAKIGGLNPRTELEACLAELEKRRLIDRAGGALAVLGITGQSALMHASDIYEDSSPNKHEQASIELAEIASTSPITEGNATQFIGDTFKLTKSDTVDFLNQANQIGFIDAEGAGTDKLYFNGNLFRKDTAQKTAKVLASLNAGEQAKVNEFDGLLKTQGYVLASAAQAMLGDILFSKLRAAAIYDMNIVSNEAGDHVLITSPSAFHKFVDPMIDDAFDHAKALVAALSYGMSVSPSERERIWGVGLLPKKLIRGEEVGPAPAIGNDYRALEHERVVKIRPYNSSRFFMKLLKKEVGELALQVLSGGGLSTANIILPSAGMRSYVGPEIARSRLRKNQSEPSKAQTRSLLNAVRGGSAL